MTLGRDEVDLEDVDDTPLDTLQELEAELETLAETNLPIAPYAQRGLDVLEEAGRR